MSSTHPLHKKTGILKWYARALTFVAVSTYYTLSMVGGDNMFDAKQMEWFNQLSAEDLAILGAGFNTLGDFFDFLALIKARQETAQSNKK
ncbi:hypothetical protein ASL14_22100 [Paenibacillus sp. IHB B 3084]|uniref:hypothetical protein n=1 Tax=Paenibacillus sp. IHB B 3084 TaxID=867076 RepID=UPI00071EC7F4|nr:hypothetical protein [Paenibacillus sp. IHB B 3084]ALP38470.1 hypothetical protein ASL14_22100 [Paenibacillus sp. IHB B 3084]